MKREQAAADLEPGSLLNSRKLRRGSSVPDGSRVVKNISQLAGWSCGPCRARSNVLVETSTQPP